MIRTVLSVLSITLLSTNAKIMRNNALMSKMVSNFKNDNEISGENEKTNIVTKMQNVLCKNFPTIPCELITNDHTLKKLIEKSIQQINKKVIDKTTQHPGYLTLFPVINSEDLSNFIQTREIHTKKRKEKPKKNKKVNKKRTVYNRKKIRKFYPHKVKFRDKAVKEYDRSEDRLSMSVEAPETFVNKNEHIAYKIERDDPPVWRIDYTKHGDPGLNMFGLNEKYKGIIKSGPNVILDDINVGASKSVLHPDVYIKKNYVRKNINVNSDAIE